MASRVASLPSDFAVDFRLLRPLSVDTLHFIHGPSFTTLPSEETFPFPTTGLSLLADKVYLGTWASDKAFGRNLYTWPAASSSYVQWLDRIQAAYGDLWKEVDIFDAIQLSRNTYQADPLLLASALCFWPSHSNTFRSAPFILTLMDVAAITGLRPYGVTLSLAFSADSMDALSPILDSKKNLSYGRFAQIFAELVTKTEYIAFL